MPLLLVYRPEGLFFAFPAAWLAISRLKLGAREAPRRDALMFTLVLLEFALFAWLYAKLPPPHIRPGLLVHNAGLFLARLLSPWLLSPLFVGGALLTWFVPLTGLLRKKLFPVGSISPFRGLAALPAWMALLLALWCIQGDEGNRIFGASRYVVMLLPMAAVSWGLLATWLEGMISPKGPLLAKTVLLRTGPLLLVLATGIPQFGMLTVESNLQKEYNFLDEARTRLPPQSLLVLPTAGSGENREFSPENSTLTMASLAGKEQRWLSLAEFAALLSDEGSRKRLFDGPPIILVQGIWEDTEGMDRLGRLCSFETLWEQKVASVPDVAYYALTEEGRELTFGLYRLRPH